MPPRANSWVWAKLRTSPDILLLRQTLLPVQGHHNNNLHHHQQHHYLTIMIITTKVPSFHPKVLPILQPSRGEFCSEFFSSTRNLGNLTQILHIFPLYYLILGTHFCALYFGLKRFHIKKIIRLKLKCAIKLDNKWCSWAKSHFKVFTHIFRKLANVSNHKFPGWIFIKWKNL